MNIPKEIEIKILGGPQSVSLLSKEMSYNPAQYKILSNEISKDHSNFDFGLVEVASLVAIIQGVVYLTDFVNTLMRALKQSKTNSVIVQTPLCRAEIEYSEDLTEEKIKEVLNKLIELP
jgi:hypothetical protein